MTTPIALTCGDPAGISPEITWKSWQALRQELPFFVVGSVRHLRSVCAEMPLIEISDPSEAVNACRDGLPVLNIAYAEDPEFGAGCPANGAAIKQSIDSAVEFCRNGQASAVCTNPINKKILRESGVFEHPGHTEYLAQITNASDVVMLLASDDLNVVPATIHIALKDVITHLTAAGLKQTIQTTDQGFRSLLGIRNPRIWVAGLNPHAGEGGLMGTEDSDLIAPVISSLKAEGLDVSGPYPADTMFHAGARANYDVAVCMYHDQALIPIKTLSFDTGVNVTLGLPIIRTSPDHGTAYDIAGKNIARPDSLISALRMAWKFAKRSGAA
jgi:4-hydroxythreonine-4-phosphate dehydrogenase